MLRNKLFFRQDTHSTEILDLDDIKVEPPAPISVNSNAKVFLESCVFIRHFKSNCIIQVYISDNDDIDNPDDDQDGPNDDPDGTNDGHDGPNDDPDGTNYGHDGPNDDPDGTNDGPNDPGESELEIDEEHFSINNVEVSINSDSNALQVFTNSILLKRNCKRNFKQLSIPYSQQYP